MLVDIGGIDVYNMLHSTYSNWSFLRACGQN